MELTLREEDRRAVDLILDRAASIGSQGNAYGSEMGGQMGPQVGFAVGDPALGERVARTYKLVHLLEALPPIEPPSDLLDRTLRFVENASANQAPETAHIPELLDTQRPIV